MQACKIAGKKKHLELQVNDKTENSFSGIHTETDKIRSTPLSGSFLQTSQIEAAILIQMFLSDVYSLNAFGSSTP